METKEIAGVDDAAQPEPLTEQAVEQDPQQQAEQEAAEFEQRAEEERAEAGISASPEQVQTSYGQLLERVTTEDLLPDAEPSQSARELEDEQLRAMLEAVVYVTEEPLTVDQIAAALNQPKERVIAQLKALTAEFQKPEHGIGVQEVAGGFKMATKAEHHDAVRTFVRNLKPPMKLSLPALETLAVVAYKQPITAPEILEIRGVQGAGVLKTLLDRKLIAAAGRKNVIGKPILYKTTREFLVQFGLRDLHELPSLKEFEELRRMSVSEPEAPEVPQEELQHPKDAAAPSAPVGNEAPVASHAENVEAGQRSATGEETPAGADTETVERRSSAGDGCVESGAGRGSGEEI